MELLAFSVYDIKAEYFTPPMFQRTVGEALRGFADEANNPNSQLHRHAGDFSLYQVGRFNQATGEFTPQPPHSLGTALEYKKASLEVDNGS